MTEPAPSEAAAHAPAPTIDPEDRVRVLEHLRAEQRLLPAIVAGCITGLIGSAVWAAVAVFTQHEIGWIAIGVGFIVGLGVRIAGRGFEVKFAAIGGFLALASVVLGKFFGLCGFFARQESLSFWEVIKDFPYSEFPTLMRETFEPMDLLFYALAVWMGWKGARRELDEAEIAQAHQKLKSET